MQRSTAEWDRAYNNGASIEDAESYPPMWAGLAADFRAEMESAGRARLDIPYGSLPQERYDLFLPEDAPQGLAVFVHGGYWMKFDKSFWSHLARGPLERGHAVALPSYSLCPEIRISGITRQIALFLQAAAAEIAGPIRLAGHSAGGHLVTRMLCADAGLPEGFAARIVRAVSISGVHDLRPLLNTSMNTVLKLDTAEAQAESPVLHEPALLPRLTCWVGADELTAFRRHNRLLADSWGGLGMEADAVEAPGRHHYDVITDLAEADSALTATLTSG